MLFYFINTILFMKNHYNTIRLCFSLLKELYFLFNIEHLVA